MNDDSHNKYIWMCNIHRMLQMVGNMRASLELLNKLGGYPPLDEDFRRNTSEVYQSWLNLMEVGITNFKSKNSTTVAELEENIFSINGIRIVIRLPPDTTVAIPRYDRAFSDNNDVGWFTEAIGQMIGFRNITVIDGNGKVPSDTTKLGEVRKSYLRTL